MIAEDQFQAVILQLINNRAIINKYKIKLIINCSKSKKDHGQEHP